MKFRRHEWGAWLPVGLLLLFVTLILLVVLWKHFEELSP